MVKLEQIAIDLKTYMKRKAILVNIGSKITACKTPPVDNVSLISLFYFNSQN
jgi:hypothetical protein